MTKKLEEVLNLLPSIESMMPDLEDTEEDLSLEDVQHDIEMYQGQMSVADRVDAALPMVQGLAELDREMDEYAKKAMDTFQDLVDLGKNVEDRHAAPIFDSASKMLTAALQAKTAKLDKKMKMIELQMRQRKLDQDEEKLKVYIESKRKSEDLEDDNAIVGEGKIISGRSELLAEIMAKMKDNDK
jgi:hypothetical protein